MRLRRALWALLAATVLVLPFGVAAAAVPWSFVVRGHGGPAWGFRQRFFYADRNQGEQGDQQDQGDLQNGGVGSVVYGNGGGPSWSDFGHGHGDQQSVSGSVYFPPGATVAEAVYTALSEGEHGLALAETIHEVLSTLHPYARGLSVAEAVYASVYGTVAGSVYESVYGPPSGGDDFSDLGETPWAVPYVSALAQSGIVQGTGPHTFSPQRPVTGVELVTMLARVLGWNTGGAATPSSLPPGIPAYARQAVQEALDSGALSQVQGLSNLDGPLTRAQAITILVDALGLGGVTAGLAQAPLPLAGTVPSWARGAVALALKLGLVQGEDGRIAADAALTRAQLAVLLTRFLALLAEAGSSTSPGP